MPKGKAKERGAREKIITMERKRKSRRRLHEIQLEGSKDRKKQEQLRYVSKDLDLRSRWMGIRKLKSLCPKDICETKRTGQKYQVEGHCGGDSQVFEQSNCRIKILCHILVTSDQMFQATIVSHLYCGVIHLK